MQDKITDLLIATDKALKELYINFVQYKDAKNLHDLQEKNKLIGDLQTQEQMKKELSDLKKLNEELQIKNETIKTKISGLKEKIQNLIEEKA